MKPLTELDLLWHKDPLTVEDAATLLLGKSGSSTAEGVLKAAIESGKLHANVVRWPAYISDMGCEIDDGSGNINQHETTIRMDDFKAYRQSIGAKIVDGTAAEKNIDKPINSDSQPSKWRKAFEYESEGLNALYDLIERHYFDASGNPIYDPAQLPLKKNLESEWLTGRTRDEADTIITSGQRKGKAEK